MDIVKLGAKFHRKANKLEVPLGCAFTVVVSLCPVVRRIMTLKYRSEDSIINYPLPTFDCVD